MAASLKSEHITYTDNTVSIRQVNQVFKVRIRGIKNNVLVDLPGLCLRMLTYTIFITHFVTHVWFLRAVCLHMLGQSLLHGINLITHRAEKLRHLWCL